MIEVRLLNNEDVRKNEVELKKLLTMVLEENVDQEIPKELVEKYFNDMDIFTKNNSAILIGAFDDENLIGFHWGYELKNIQERRIHSYLNAIEYVYRGKGIGSRFWELLEKETKKRGISIIEAMCTYSNQIAVNYHLHRGFEIERLKVKKVLK